MLARCPFSMRKIASALALIGISTHAGAVLVADGKLGDSAVASSHGTAAAAAAEGYSIGYSITYFDNGKAIGSGQLWFGTDAAGDQYIYYMLPTTYVDNTYGTNSSSIWSDIGKTHTFDNLLGSDSMGEGPNFTWIDKATGKTNAARVDYIADCFTGNSSGVVTDAANCGAGNTSGYKSGGMGKSSAGMGLVTGTNGAGPSNTWDKIDADLTGSASSVLEIATSLEYDLKNIAPTALTNSSLDPNWIKEVGYELKFKAGTFDPATFGQNVTLNSGGTSFGSPGVLNYGDPHVSPAAAGLSSFGPPCLITQGGSCGMPEPGSAWLLGAALGAMGWYARRRSKRPDTGDVPSETPGAPAPS